MLEAKSGPASGHAVVLGAGMAGLLAARVLADRCAKVTLVDRDEVRSAGGWRKGVPQGKHLHGLQPRGQQVIEELFPGLTAAAVAEGGQTGDVAANVRVHLGGRQIRKPVAGLVLLSVSRPFLERHVRERVLALPGVELIERCDVVGLLTTESRDRVTGVRLAVSGAEAEVVADLVVDATGRGSRTPTWLEEWGYGRVEEDGVKIGLGYATRLYRLGSGLPADEVGINTIASPEVPRGGICTRIEGDRAIVTAYGILGDHPPTDPDGFTAFLESLAVPDLAKALADAEPLTDPVPYRYPTSRRRRYERMRAFPRGLLPIGDSVCSFNPSYAQGMTVAALSALVLREHLRSADPDPRAYLRDLARRVLDRSWDMMTSSDLGHPRVAGERGALLRLMNAYMRRVQLAATADDRVAATLMRVSGLVDPPSKLVRPDRVLRVLRLARRAVARRPRRTDPKR
ncbi:FAD-dependent oxidoreductase [Saccharothrix sp. Mg75]|uniref:FAD-dependent oxidoreductase n=1 Tax=Saccharothrix sp. Mg75 TaxID=3445357 RepID=UPI003EEABC47